MSNDSLIKINFSLVSRLCEELTDLLLKGELPFVGFKIPDVLAVDEDKYELEGRPEFETEVLNEWHQAATVVNSLSNFKVKAGVSTKYVSRLPGLIVVPKSIRDDVLQLVEQINSLKNEISVEVRKKAATPRKRHELIHTEIPMVMTHQLYRVIPIITTNVHSAYYRWKDDTASPSFSKSGAIEYLQKLSKSRRKISTELDWLNFIEEMIATVSSSDYELFRTKKYHKVKPVFEYTYNNGDKLVKSNSTTATVPILLIGQENDTELPSYSALGDYSPTKATVRKAHNAKVEVRLNPNFNLYGIAD